MTVNIMAFSIMKVSIMTVSIMTVSIMTVSIITVGMSGAYPSGAPCQQTLYGLEKSFQRNTLAYFVAASMLKFNDMATISLNSKVDSNLTIFHKTFFVVIYDFMGTNP